MDLQRAIEGGLRPDPKFTLPIVLHLLAGLGHAHEHGIVHRDVKPSNLFLPKGRPAKIMDFGVARLVGTHTSTGLVIGTPHYMSPEQVKAADLDGRSDLFSTGLILYELVTGEKAYKADSIVTLLFKIAHETPDFDLIPKGPRWERLRHVLQRSLERDPANRYPDAAAMAADLERALRELGGFFDSTAGAEQAFMRGATPRPMPQPTFVAPTPRPEPKRETLTPTLTPDLGGPRDSYSPTVLIEPKEPAGVSRRALLVGGGLGVVALVILATAVVLSMRSPGTRQAPPRATAASPTTAAPSSPLAAAGIPPPPRSKPTPLPTPRATPPPTDARATDTAPPAGSSTTATPAVSRTEARLDRANDLMERGRYAQALAEARAVLQREPTNAEASALAGDAEAAILIEEAVKKARAALKAGDKEAALVEIKKGLAANPSEGRLLALFREARQ
jgi:serine/threonine protein kinase